MARSVRCNEWLTSYVSRKEASFRQTPAGLLKRRRISDQYCSDATATNALHGNATKMQCKRAAKLEINHAMEAQHEHGHCAWLTDEISDLELNSDDRTDERDG